MNKAKGKIKLVFPTEEYKNQVEEYLQEHFDNGEFDLAGDGGLDEIKNFDRWIQKIKSDLSEETITVGRVPSTLFLGVRKLDNRVVGTIQIRHKLNDYLFKYGGHIGDGVRPSERNKGYATEMIRLALLECKKLGINRVLMTCDKNNIGSSKSITNNGGDLENEVKDENGKTIQRYWISLKKRFANTSKEPKKVIKQESKIKYFDDEYFKGDIYLSNFIKMSGKEQFKDSKLCAKASGYKWLQFYNYGKKICLTTIYDDKNEIVEWYFDIARKIGKENGIPYEDDLYLDVVLTAEGKTILLDEEEFEEAFKKYEFTKDEYDEAYEIANSLMKKINGKADEMKKFTDKYLKIMLEES